MALSDMKRKYPVLVLLVLLIGGSVLGQNVRRAHTLFEDASYEEAIEIYKQYLLKNDDFLAKLRLARAYRAVGELGLAALSYADVVADSASLPVHKFELGKVLKAQGKYNRAKAWFETYAMESADPSLGEKWARSCEDALDLKRDSLGYTIRAQKSVNTKYSEISPVVYKAGVAFSSNRKRGFLFRFFNGYKRGAFYDLYYSEKSSDQRLRKPAYLRDKINTRYHDGPTIFSASENVAFVTRSNMGDIGGRRDAAGYNRVNIYMLENRVDKWRDAKPLPFSSKEYNVAHPAVSEDGQTLYFSSDMPGGFGGTDIWVTRYKDGKWLRPTNLGPLVNSEANEGYPFLASDSLLYFSSDRAEGFGGKDIFYARYRGGEWNYIRNAGYPLNSEADDFGYSMEPGSPYGYFVSNREGGEGDDDIYGFKRYRALEGQVVDARTGEPLRGVTVQIEDINMKSHFYSTDDDGLFTHYMRVGNQVLMEADLEDYHGHKARIGLDNVAVDENKFVLVPLEEIRRLMLEGKLKDADDGKAIDGAVVKIIGNNTSDMASDAQGTFERELEPEQDYTVVMVKEGYVPQIVDLSTYGQVEPKKYIIDADMRKGPFVLLEGIVTDKDKGLVVPQANIHIVEANTQEELQAFKTRKDGMFWKTLDHQGNFSIIATMPDYLTARYDVLRDSSMGDTLRASLQLIPLELGKVAKVIYYDYDRSDIRILGMRNLNEIAYFLNDNPEISVELNAHTDSRGSSRYNLKLSQRRSDAAVSYLVSRGISKDRILARGYGESQLLNDCGDGRNCDEVLHQQNRRTEVKIVGIDKEIKEEKDQENVVRRKDAKEVREESYEKGQLEYREEIRQQ